MKENIIELYMNYLHAIRMREEYGDIYGDTDDTIEHFAEEINKHLLGHGDLNHQQNFSSNNDKILNKKMTR